MIIHSWLLFLFGGTFLLSSVFIHPISASQEEDADIKLLLSLFSKKKPSFNKKAVLSATPTYLRLQSTFARNHPQVQKQCHQQQGVVVDLTLGKQVPYHHAKPPQILITPEDIDNALQYAIRAIETRFPEFIALASTEFTGVDHREVEGQLLELVGEYFAKYKCFTKLQLLNALPQIAVPPLFAYLPQPLFGNGSSCSKAYGPQHQCARALRSRFRTLDGSCNNLARPGWGRANSCQSRLLPPDYADGLAAIRVAASGRPLPLPRELSRYGVGSTVGVAATTDYRGAYSVLTLAWGQMVVHDLSLTSVGKTLVSKKVTSPNYQTNCCKRRRGAKCSTILFEAGQAATRSEALKHPFQTVLLLPGDRQKSSSEFTSSSKQAGQQLYSRCTNFQRAHACPQCVLGPRAAMNRQTAFLDASLVYGTSEAEAASLRLHKDGLLRVARDSSRSPILPGAPPSPETTCSPVAGVGAQRCFVAGDRRVNQHPLLVAMHTVLLRRHNFHASRLKAVNSGGGSYGGKPWSDDRLFEEARRLLIAELQHITSGEYVPFLLGPHLTAHYGLGPLSYGNGYTTYQPATNPSIKAEFSIAARFGHSQIRDTYRAASPGYLNTSAWALGDNFFEPGFAWAALTDDLLRGAATDASGAIDNHFSFTAQNLVAKTKAERFGLDLVATNTLRGRDLGIPGYVYFLKGCFGVDVRRWADLERYIPREVVERLQEIYEDVQDVDLFIAGMAERPLSSGGGGYGNGSGSRLGPTFSCIVGGQLYAMKYGDRYWYEHGGQAGSFTGAQLSNIRATASLAALLCQTSAVGAIQPRPFYLPDSTGNPLLSCDSYPELDYRLWREEEAVVVEY